MKTDEQIAAEMREVERDWTDNERCWYCGGETDELGECDYGAACPGYLIDHGLAVPTA